MDVKTTFLIGDLGEEIFVRKPERFIDKNHSNMICNCRKTFMAWSHPHVAGTKLLMSSSSNWGTCKNDADADPRIYHKRFIKYILECILIIAVYADDVIIASNDTEALQLEKKILGELFEMEDEG